jgi:glutamate racemase
VQQAIAVLDSGVGGLTVVKEVMRQLPCEKIVYFGDTARAPYGPRPAGDVLTFTREIVDYLVQYEPKMIVIACNTATAVALEDIRLRVKLPIIGVINPGARAAVSLTQTGVVGVIGTEGTINSGAYELALTELMPQIRVISRACPTFVPLVEAGSFDSKETYETVFQSLLPLRRSTIDCLILGCTHYPFLLDPILSVMGPEVTLINSAEETAREIRAILYENNVLASKAEMPLHQFFCSGDPRKFQDIAQAWLGESIHLTPVVWRVPRLEQEK